MHDRGTRLGLASLDAPPGLGSAEWPNYAAGETQAAVVRQHGRACIRGALDRVIDPTAFETIFGDEPCFEHLQPGYTAAAQRRIAIALVALIGKGAQAR